LEYRFLSAERIKDLSTCARKWLVALQKERERKHHTALVATLQILSGLWICEKGLSDEGALSAIRTQIQIVLQQIDTLPEISAALLHAGPLLVLTSTGILHALQIQNRHLEAFASEIAHSLQCHTDQNDADANELFLTRFLLYRLHLHPPLCAYGFRELAAQELLLADERILRSLTTDIIAATQFGQIKIATRNQFFQTLTALLPTLIIDAFRGYHLERGMELLRCLRYLNVAKMRSIHTSVDFLLAQQQSCGKFGFFAPDLALLQSSATSFELDLKIYLPYTISFLWTLAEIVQPAFTLVTSF
jgi:hypothetical protein